MPLTKTSLFASLAIAQVLSAGAADTDIVVKNLGNNQYDLTFHTSTTINIFEAQRELTATAKRACGDKEVHFGHYTFAINAPLSDPARKSTNLMFTQTIRCGIEAPTNIPQTASAPDGWKPTANDQFQIETQTYAYYGAKDAGDYAKAYALFADAMKEASHFDTWSANARAQNAKAGHVLNRLIVKITWYKDPPSALEPGIYAAADFSGQFENDPIYCGYLAWHRGADGQYKIIREEENYIDKGSIAKMTQTEVVALAAKLGCPVPQ